MAEVLPVLSEREQLTFIEHNDEIRFHTALSFGRLHRDQQALAELSAGWLVNGKAVAQESLAERALLARDSTDPALADKIKKLLALRTELAGLKPGDAQTGAGRRASPQTGWVIRSGAGVGSASQSGSRPARARQPLDRAGRGARALAADAVLVDIARFRAVQLRSQRGRKNTGNRPAMWPGSYRRPAKGMWKSSTWEQPTRSTRPSKRPGRRSSNRPRRSKNRPMTKQPAEEAALEPLKKLAALVFEPLKPHLAGAKQIVLSPDSNLWLVPWAALPVEEGKYAIEQWQIRYVTSGRDVVAEQLVGQAHGARPDEATDVRRSGLQPGRQTDPGRHPGRAPRQRDATCHARRRRPFGEWTAEGRSPARHGHGGRSRSRRP